MTAELRRPIWICLEKFSHFHRVWSRKPSKHFLAPKKKYDVYMEKFSNIKKIELTTYSNSRLAVEFEFVVRVWWQCSVAEIRSKNGIKCGKIGPEMTPAQFQRRVWILVEKLGHSHRVRFPRFFWKFFCLKKDMI